MQPDESKTVRLGWIALDVVVGADGAPTSADVTLHGEKGSTVRGALVFAQVAEAAQRELQQAVFGQEAGSEGPSAATEHAATCANDGPAAVCGCRTATSVSDLGGQQ